MRVGQYTKAIVMILAAGVGILTAALSDNVVTPVEFVNVAIAILTAVGVYLVPNLPAGPGKVGKFIVALGGAAFTALAVIVANVTGFGDVTTSDWLAVLLAGLAAVGLYIIPNSDAIPVVEVSNIGTVEPAVVGTVGTNHLPEHLKF